MNNIISLPTNWRDTDSIRPGVESLVETGDSRA